VGHSLIRRYDQIVDVADLFADVVVDALPEDLLLRTPPHGDLSQLGRRDADRGAGRLRHSIGRTGGDDETREHYQDDRSHGAPPPFIDGQHGYAGPQTPYDARRPSLGT